VRLPSIHPLVPVEFALKALELEVCASECKEIGNAAFKAKQYPSALEAYSKGLHACGKDDDLLKRDLHRNRSLVNIYQERYEEAFDEACAALISDAADNEVILKNNVKALYRAGRALNCLEQFSEAQVKFESLLQISPDDKDGREQLTRTKARLEESATGKYDFTAMSNSRNGDPARFDRASFTANVEIRPAGKKGKGLFATKDIKAGELILVKKAFCVAFLPKIGDGTHMIMNLDSGDAHLGAQAGIVQELFQKMSRNPKQARRVLDLYDGGYSPKCKAKAVDGMTAIDMFQLTAISRHNCFGRGDPGEETHAPKGTNPAPAATGLWVTASYFNHACDANAVSAFQGDCIILRATKDIEKGQEVTMSYRSRDFDYVENQQRLQKTWKFKCDCTMCAADAQTSAADRRQRQGLIKEMTAFVEEHEPSFQYNSDKAAIAAAEKLYAKLDATYDNKAFKNVPRPALAELVKWLCGAYTSHQNNHKILPTAIKILQDCGYAVKVVGQSLRIDRARCYFSQTGIDAAVYAVHACNLAGNKALSKQFEKFASEMYLAKYGEMTMFEEVLGGYTQSK
jgi:tetratricopeptide (TPR) repeat protein